MSRDDWFRRNTWTDRDRDEFNTKLAISKLDNRAQYLRIQAGCLADSGNDLAAIELLDRVISEFPDRIQLAQAHVQKAESLARLGKIDSAVQHYRLALQAEREFPNVKTNAWVDFPWFIVERQFTDLYVEAISILAEMYDESNMSFPVTRYRYSVVRSLIADACGDKLMAQEFAKKALAEESVDHSGFRYHAKLGLVGSDAKAFHDKLKILARD